MKTSTTHRLMSHFQEAVLKRKNVMENVLASAYDEFSEHLVSLAGSGLSLVARLRYLRHMETELDAYMNILGSRSNDQLHIYLMRTSGLIKTEIELLYFTLRDPEYQDAIPDTDKQQTDLSFPRWKDSLVNLMELIASLYYLGVITDANGTRQSFASLVVAFEKFLHIRIPKPYDLRADLARRKKSLSVLLPKLREAFEKNIINCGIGYK